MRSLPLVLALSSALTAALPAAAADFAGSEIFIPVISRVPGVNHTQWRSDLVISNRSDTAETSVKIVYEPAGSAVPMQGSFFVPPHGTVTIPDALSEVFELSQSFGTLWLAPTNDDAKITAHVRIYNVGTAEGEFGQVIQGLPIAQLGKTAWLNGLIGIRDNRTNIGIANPHNTNAHYSFSWYDKAGHLLGTRTAQTIEPWDVSLLNDIFTQLNIPPDDGVAIKITADVPIYAYASIVRNDTGDAYTIIGNGSDQ
jgi:hypothetical protein